MIWSVETGERVPIASLHSPDGKVELLRGFNAPPLLMILTGAADHSVSAGQLLEQVSAKPELGLALGVVGAGISGQDLDALLASLDAVFVVPGEAIARVARSLALAVTTPGEPGHPWCSDWNDMRSLVSGTGPHIGRTGFARAGGPSAARDAAILAVERSGSVENCRVLSLLTGPQSLRGAQIKEVSAEIRSRLGKGEHIAGVLQEPSFAADTVQVDIFVFGPASPQPASTAKLSPFPSEVEISEIPSFLRNR